VLFGVVIPLILYNLYTGVIIGKLEVPGVFKVEFREKTTPAMPPNRSPKDLPDDERVQRQGQLEKQLRDLEDRLRSTQTPQEGRSARFQQQFDINGTWRDAERLSYQIVQRGNDITVQGPVHGIIANGRGVIAGQEINGDFYTNDYTMGRLRLRVSDDAKRITGTAQTIYGKTNNIELFR